jgi:hypothetical protein
MPEDARERRAKRRRASWEGSIVPARAPKPELHAPSFTLERLTEMWRLCARLWQASGRELPRFSRTEMPGEVFVIRRD